MNRFNKDTSHLVVNESNERESCPKVLNKQTICNRIHPRFFPDLRREPSDLKTNRSFADSVILDNVVTVAAPPSEKWLQKWSNELREFKLIQSQIGTCIDMKTLDVVRYLIYSKIS